MADSKQKDQSERYGNPEDAAGVQEDAVDHTGEILATYDRNREASEKAAGVRDGKHSDKERRENVEKGLAPEGPNNEQLKQPLHTPVDADLNAQQLGDVVGAAQARFNAIPLNSGERNASKADLEEVAKLLEDGAKRVRQHAKNADA